MTLRSDPLVDTQVLIVGGGLAGISAAYELAQQGIYCILVETGTIGYGSAEFRAGTPGSRFSKMLCPDTVDSDIATLRGYGLGDLEIKGYLELARWGKDILTERAESLEPGLIKKMGTILVAHGVQKQCLEQEVRKYRRLGFGSNFGRHVSVEELVELYGFTPTLCDGGRYLPHDGRIDLDNYLRLLVKECTTTGLVQFRPNTKVIEVGEERMLAYGRTNNGECITAQNILLATNGFYAHLALEGLVETQWCFSASFDDRERTTTDTPNLWQFTRNFKFMAGNGGILTIGGEDKRVRGTGSDRFSLYVPPSRPYRKVPVDPGERLVSWVWRNIPSLAGKLPLEENRGVFSSTKDELPIVGKLPGTERTYTLIADNGIGTVMLSGSASLLPAIMGYTAAYEDQKLFIELISPERKTLRQ